MKPFLAPKDVNWKLALYYYGRPEDSVPTVCRGIKLSRRKCLERVGRAAGREGSAFKAGFR
eukprot:107229-Hanusia_phi.AAC.1